MFEIRKMAVMPAHSRLKAEYLPALAETEVVCMKSRPGQQLQITLQAEMAQRDPGVVEDT